ncbi:DUF6232 family protein [Pseudomonadota bacterium]
MAEDTILIDGGIQVTTSRFIVNGQTYAMSGITSVRQLEKLPDRTMPVILSIVGLLLFFAHFVAALIVIAIAAVIWKGQETDYAVVLATAGGETQALNSTNQGYIEKIVLALDDAIIQRG